MREKSFPEAILKVHLDEEEKKINGIVNRKQNTYGHLLAFLIMSSV